MNVFLSIGFFTSLFCVLGTFKLVPIWFAAIGLIEFVLCLVSPRVGLAVLLVCLPVFGHKPGTTQFFSLVLLAGATDLALCLRGLFRPPWGDAGGPGHRHPIVVLSALFLLASLASLTSLPLKQILLDLRGIGFQDGRFLLAKLAWFFSLQEKAAAYSILSVVLTAQAAITGYFVYALTRTDSKTVPALGWAFLGGLVLTLVAGVLDYCGWIDLRALRNLDPSVNPGGRQFRLQSFFGHSGWLAEYLTLSVPFVLMLLFTPFQFWKRVALILALLVAVGTVLVLSYQRGSWLSFPLPLLVIWMAIHYVGRRERAKDRLAFSEFLRSSSIAIVVSLALTVALSVSVVFAVGYAQRKRARAQIEAVRGAHPGEQAGVRGGLAEYADRFRLIGQITDRTRHFRAGVLLGSIHPLLGGGSDSFAYQYQKEFVEGGGRHVGLMNLGEFSGTAHNVYAQTFSGKGLAGLALLLAVLGWFLTRQLRLLARSNGASRNDTVLALLGLSFLSVFVVYGNVQEMLYPQSVQLLVFAGFGLLAGLPRNGAEWTRPTVAKCGIAFLAVCALHLAWEFDYPGPGKAAWLNPADHGCYDPEKGDDGQPLRWCNRAFEKEFKVEPWGEQLVAVVPVQVYHPDIRNHPIEVRVGVAGREIGHFRFLDLGRKVVLLPVPSALRGLVVKGKVRLEVAVNEYFIPLEWMAGVKDARVLSLMVLEGEVDTRALLGRCYDEETTSEGKGAWCPQTAVFSYPVEPSGSREVRARVRFWQPDARDFPVELFYGQLGSSLFQKTVEGPGSVAIDLAIDEKKLERVNGQWRLPVVWMTSIPWIPSRYGPDRDDRVLGIWLWSESQTVTPDPSRRP